MAAVPAVATASSLGIVIGNGIPVLLLPLLVVNTHGWVVAAVAA